MFRIGLRSLLAVALVCCSAVSAAVSLMGFMVELGNVAYFLPPKVAATIAIGESKILFGDAVFVPFTVLNGTGNSVAEVTSITAKYLEVDDVFQEGFLDGMSAMVATSEHSLNVAVLYMPKAKQTYTSSIQIRNITSTILTGSVTLPPGPYFLSATGFVYEAWRLYSDTNGAFTESAIATSPDTYTVLPAGIVGQNLAIAVPSRLYYQKTSEKPLAGVRIGIKDIYNIKDLRTFQ
jgi:hypothetical protein